KAEQRDVRSALGKRFHAFEPGTFRGTSVHVMEREFRVAHESWLFVPQVKLFGTALDALQHCVVQDYGSVPCFLLDACTSLLEHVQTEGIFRKSGSVARIKALQAKLDQGEDCLSSALPLDVAGLLKQFFRELPEPILPVGFHRALLKAQKLATWAERTKATMLLSCVLPEQNLSALQYFFSFLQSVSKRSAENRMDSSNLSVVFAPNLLHSAEGTKKMNGSTERKLKLQAAVVQCFIENAQYFGKEAAKFQ
uniref:Rho-GAP domain-containing protein n=1 Tax=Denticeps clupeoides TaxID=299321 RepID=A0A8C4ADK8_9TELE